MMKLENIINSFSKESRSQGSSRSPYKQIKQFELPFNENIANLEFNPFTFGGPTKPEGESNLPLAAAEKHFIRSTSNSQARKTRAERKT